MPRSGCNQSHYLPLVVPIIRSSKLKQTRHKLECLKTSQATQTLKYFITMKKSILNVGKKLNKADQQEITGGGLKPRPIYCEDICPTASAGTPCGPPHCPGVCDGNGGWINY